jgi:hypothetical protein
MGEGREGFGREGGINTARSAGFGGFVNALQSLPPVEKVFDGTKMYDNPNCHVIQQEPMFHVIFDA